MKVQSYMEKSMRIIKDNVNGCVEKFSLFENVNVITWDAVDI